VHDKKVAVEDAPLHLDPEEIWRCLSCRAERGAASGRNRKCLLKKQDVAPLQRSVAETSGLESGVSLFRGQISPRGLRPWSK